jgi:hypothetical protein
MRLTLSPDAVAEPARTAAALAANVVSECITRLAGRDLQDQPSIGFAMNYQFRLVGLETDDRRKLYENWLLARGFQDLARGIRTSFERALVYNAFAAAPSHSMTVGEFQSVQKKANKLLFPELLRDVNAGLREPLAFEAEFRSLQNVRNCLEHRNGAVGAKDIDRDAQTLTLTFPRLKVFLFVPERKLNFAPASL